jgi:Flp pilus assembly protein TadG
MGPEGQGSHRKTDERDAPAPCDRRRDGGGNTCCCRGFRANSKGSVAVEFALLVVPFLSLVFAIFQTSMVHITGELLQTAVSDSSRLIMTGQAQAQAFDKARFKEEVCKRMPAMVECASMLELDVRTYSSFSGASVSAPPITDGLMDTSGFGFSPGTSNEIVVVRGVLPYKIWIPFVGKSFANLADNRILLMGSAAFKNEPF